MKLVPVTVTPLPPPSRSFAGLTAVTVTWRAGGVTSLQPPSHPSAPRSARAIVCATRSPEIFMALRRSRDLDGHAAAGRGAVAELAGGVLAPAVSRAARRHAAGVVPAGGDRGPAKPGRNRRWDGAVTRANAEPPAVGRAGAGEPASVNAARGEGPEAEAAGNGHRHGAASQLEIPKSADRDGTRLRTGRRPDAELAGVVGPPAVCHPGAREPAGMNAGRGEGGEVEAPGDGDGR